MYVNCPKPKPNHDSIYLNPVYNLQEISGSGAKVCTGRLKKSKCIPVVLHDHTISYIRNYWRYKDVPGTHEKLTDGNKSKDVFKTSAGFFGIALALHLCGQVNIYGFTQTEDYYYRKIRVHSKRSFNIKHNWASENYCTKEFANYCSSRSSFSEDGSSCKLIVRE